MNVISAEMLQNDVVSPLELAPGCAAALYGELACCWDSWH